MAVVGGVSPPPILLVSVPIVLYGTVLYNLYIRYMYYSVTTHGRRDGLIRLIEFTLTFYAARLCDMILLIQSRAPSRKLPLYSMNCPWLSIPGRSSVGISVSTC